MEKPTNFHFNVIFFQTFGKKHQVVIMAPNNITILIMFIHHISKHLVCFLVCIKLRLKTAGSCEAILLWKPKIMEKRPQDVVAIPIIVLMNYFFIKKNRDAPLQSKKRTYDTWAPTKCCNRTVQLQYYHWRLQVACFLMFKSN